MGELMDHVDLKKIVDRLEVPAITEAGKERILAVANARYRAVGDHGNMVADRLFARAISEWIAPLWKPVVAFSLMALVILTPVYRTSELSQQVADLRYELELLHEYKELFSGDLKALVKYNGQVDLVLGGDELSQSNPPVLIDFRNKAQSVRVIGYSGQSISFQLGAKAVILDVLTTPEGEVLLSGGDFVWSKGIAPNLNGYRVDARLLRKEL